MKIGSNRPASTGVIGQNPRSSTSSVVIKSQGLIPSDNTGRKQKPIMDLIEEDFPKGQSPDYHSVNLSSHQMFPTQKQFQGNNHTESQTINQYNGYDQHGSFSAQTTGGSQTQFSFPLSNSSFDRNVSSHASLL